MNNEELNVGAGLVSAQGSKYKTNTMPVGASIARPFRKNQGITLIALIITIIVMLILAGVVLNLTIGERGIFKTAQNVAKNYTNAENYEKNQIEQLENIFTNRLSQDTSDKEPNKGEIWDNAFDNNEDTYETIQNETKRIYISEERWGRNDIDKIRNSIWKRC